MGTEDSLSEILYPQWQNEYAAALLETDPQNLSARVEAAETAIYKRLQELSQDSDNRTERQVIEDALQSLKVLKRSELTPARGQEDSAPSDP
jgi:hypothetical protein